EQEAGHRWRPEREGAGRDIERAHLPECTARAGPYRYQESRAARVHGETICSRRDRDLVDDGMGRRIDDDDDALDGALGGECIDEPGCWIDDRRHRTEAAAKEKSGWWVYRCHLVPRAGVDDREQEQCRSIQLMARQAQDERLAPEVGSLPHFCER